MSFLKSIIYFLFYIAISCSFSRAQEKSLVTIKGFAPDYVGKTLEVYQIEDYLSLKEIRIAQGEVNLDSTFLISFFINSTQKVLLKSQNNKAFMYVQPSGVYNVFFPDRDKYDVYRPAGNQVELKFYGLDTNDVNYKILLFNRWSDNFIASNLRLIKTNPARYNQQMDTFKLLVQDAFIQDSGKYSYDYIKFSLASLDNIQQSGDRNRYEKHDFYLKYSPVLYQNDSYMEYFKNYYQGMIPRLTMECNNRVYLGVLKSSPTMVMKALGLEYSLVNMRIRELVMIQSLSESYFGGDFPQTNIITILDSVSKHAMFEDNKLIATNMMARLTDVVAGGKAPDFAISNLSGELKTLADFKKKHLYIHFFDPTSDKNKIELPILKDLYEKYESDVTFITIVQSEKGNAETKEILKQLPWEVFVTPSNNQVFNRYKIQTFPNYVFIDAYSYVIAAPALGPQPNGSYETIDRSFFQLQKINKEMRGE